MQDTKERPIFVEWESLYGAGIGCHLVMEPESTSTIAQILESSSLVGCCDRFHIINDEFTFQEFTKITNLAFSTKLKITQIKLF